MVDAINNNIPSSTLLRAQASVNLDAVRTGPRAAQTIINRLANGAPPTIVQQAKPAGGSSSKAPLPPGSLVDILV